MTHLEVRMEKDLSALRGRVGEQAAKVEAAIKQAVHALQTGDQGLAYATILGDHPINRTMREIDRLCHGFIAVHLPSAGILRLLSSMIRVNIELERIGDYAVTICREAVQVAAPPRGHLAREIERVAGSTLLMLHQSILAFSEQNAEMARSTMALAHQIEANMDGVYDELVENQEQKAVKDLLAVFVVFTQLKRVADQAKNICEETVFSAVGEQKKPKTVPVMFVDEDNSLLSQMAVAIARNGFPKSGRFSSVGREPAAALNPALVKFLETRGIDTFGITPWGVKNLTHAELADQQLIVSLQGPVRSYFPQLPFHTSALEWDLGDLPAEPDEAQLEDLYRKLAVQIRDLMYLLRGEAAQ
jgi:phosphate transport system protein